MENRHASEKIFERLSFGSLEQTIPVLKRWEPTCNVTWKAVVWWQAAVIESRHSVCWRTPRTPAT